MRTSRLLRRFVGLSTLAIFSFFVPISDEKCLVVMICTWLKQMLEPVLGAVVLGFILLELMHSIKNKSVKNLGLSYLSLIVLLISIGIGAEAKEAISLAFSIAITVFVSGSLTIFITDSGLVEFVAFYLEKFMRKMLKVPGCAVIDIITSFFGSSSVGVFVTNKFYEEKKYTQKEACLIASNFSVVSFGFMYGIISITQLNHMSNLVIGIVILMNLILGMIMGSIPPISKKSDFLIDGSWRNIKLGDNERITLYGGIKKGMMKAKEFSIGNIYVTMKRTLTFCCEIVTQVIPIYFISLLIMNYTNFFQYIGKPLEVILKCAQISDAELIAPSIIIGILEVSLPAVYISELSLLTPTRFFVAVLSLIQIIFFTETANAILQSKIPMNILDLIKIFVIRTIIAIPILGLLMSLLF